LLRRVFSGVILILLLMGIFALAFNVQPVKASGTIYIRADGSIDPPTAPILTVDNVTYTFTGNITSDADGIVVEKDNIVVDGARYTLQGTGVYPYKGIDLTSRSNVTIKNTRINAFWCSIYLSGSSGNSVSGNNITNNDYGILFLWSSNCNRISGNNITANKNHGISLFDSSDNNSISGNNLRNNGEGIELWSSSSNSMVGNNITNMWDGITLTNSSNNKLRDNNMSDNQYNFGVYGLELSDLINDVDSSNTVDGKLVCYWVNRHDEVVPADAGYVAVVNSTDITVKNLDLKNNGQGILLAYSKNSTITGNNVTNNWVGLLLAYTNNSKITNNSITNNWYGILLGYSSGNSVSGNSVTANKYSGIRLYESSGNNIYHNNFVDNSEQVDSDGSTNVWDDGYPSGGNYWSDYAGVDVKSGLNQDLPESDGIGDTPYIIDADNQDRYPLMHPWSSLPVHNINTGLGCATIQEAIDAPETLDGHTIFVEAGTYYENVVVNKSLTLIGENREATIIDANGTGNVIDVKADDVVIESFTLQNSGYEANGINIGSCERAIIRNNSIINNDCGINIWDSRHNTISGNNVTNNYWGINLQYSVNNTLRNNHMSSNQRNFCVMGDIPSYFIHDIDSSNTVDDKPIYYWVNQQNRTVPIDAGYVALIYSTNITAQNLELKNNYQGLLLVETEYSLIMGNNITNNTRGIHLILSSNNTISENNLINNGFGIFLDDAVNNIIFRNNVAKNYYGMCVCARYQFWNTTGNIIYHNNFINNTQQVDIVTRPSYPNFWDDGYPSGGNFWSDYTGVDGNGDGIGDDEYVIDANNTDRYPLIIPLVWNYSNPIPIVWEGTIYQVALSSNSTISAFKFNQPNMQISFNVSGPSGTVGYCNATIPKSLVSDNPWTITIDGQPPIDIIVTSNDTHSFLYFTYMHGSTRNIIIQGTHVVPEFPSFMILPLFMVLTMLAVVFCRGKILRRDRRITSDAT
jgi:parallel beta-helix repeat protein